MTWNNEQVLYGYNAMRFNLKTIRDAICEKLNAIMLLYLDEL